MPVASTGIIQHCLQIQESMPETIELSGILFLKAWPYQQSRYQNPGLRYRMDLQSGEITLIDGTESAFPDRMNTSPDRKWYFEYVESEGSAAEEVWLHTIDGPANRVSAWNPEWGQRARWLDAQHLILEFPILLGNYTNREFIILNPFNNQINTQTIDFPSPLNLDWPFVMPDKTFERAIYTSGGYYFLMDINRKNDIWHRIGWIKYGGIAGWSADGQWFAALMEVENGIHEMILVDRNGEERQLTDLASAYPGYKMSVTNALWSPDGRKLALLVEFIDESGEKKIKNPVLMIADLASDEILDTCLVVSDDAPPSWSPDSRQIVFGSPGDYLASLTSVIHPTTPLHDSTILIDPAQGLAVWLAEDMVPSMWMVKP